MMLNVALPDHAILGSGVFIFVRLGELKVEHWLILVTDGPGWLLEPEDGDLAWVTIGVIRLTDCYLAVAVASRRPPTIWWTIVASLAAANIASVTAATVASATTTAIRTISWCRCWCRCWCWFRITVK